MDETGTLLVHRRVDTPRQDLLPTKLVELLSPEGTGESPCATVIAVPGPVDYGVGRPEWAPHLPLSWVSELNEAWLGDYLGVFSSPHAIGAGISRPQQPDVVAPFVQ